MGDVQSARIFLDFFTLVPNAAYESHEALDKRRVNFYKAIILTVGGGIRLYGVLFLLSLLGNTYSRRTLKR